jgi:hypothetical protein
MKLPGNFEPDKRYLLKGETLIAWRKALLADRVLPGNGLVETGGGPNGRILSVAGSLPRPPVHPFAIRAWHYPTEEKTSLQVAHGAFTAHRYGENGSGDWTASSTDYAVRMGGPSGDFLGWGDAAPAIELGSNLTYGVWVLIPLNSSSTGVSGVGTWKFINSVGDPWLVASVAATTPGASGLLGLVGEYHAWYIGRVEVDTAGAPQWEQYRRSDITHSGSTWFEPEPSD